MVLIPCPECKRHVYASETSCPFCSHDLGGVAATAPRRAPVGRMSRAALVVLGMSSVACGGDAEQSDKTSDDTNTGSTTNGGTMTTGMATVDGTANAVYGSPTIGFTTTASTSSGFPIYGAPATGSDVGAGGAPTGGTGGTDGGGAAGEANDMGVGGSTPLPTTDGGQPIYGAPPAP